MAKKGTTRKTKREIEKETSPLMEPQLNKDGDDTDGQKSKAPVLDISTFQNAFRSGQGGYSAIRALLESGDKPEDLLLRATFPSKRTEGLRFLIAFAHHIAKCREFHDKTAEEEANFFMNGIPAIDNERIKLAVQAIIGEKPRFNDRENTWGKKIQHAAWGNKDAERE